MDSSTSFWPSDHVEIYDQGGIPKGVVQCFQGWKHVACMTLTISWTCQIFFRSQTLPHSK